MIVLPSEKKHFYVLPLGTSAGVLEDTLSSYLIAAFRTQNFIALDAGSLCSAIKKIPPEEYEKIGVKSKTGNSLGTTLLTEHIKAYLISHAHLDHINGLVMCSTLDSQKEILGIDPTIDNLRDHIFNWKIWPNFANEGTQPQLNKYHYQRLKVTTLYPIPGTQMQVQAFPLNHGMGYPSTAFLIESEGYYLIYFGDTGADSIEDTHNLQTIWETIASLIRAHKLTAIFIEVSALNDRPNKHLCGHLRPDLLLSELNKLAHIVNPKKPTTALENLPIVVTHIKQGLENQNISELIIKQLNETNLSVKFIIPQSGKLLMF